MLHISYNNIDVEIPLATKRSEIHNAIKKQTNMKNIAYRLYFNDKVLDKFPYIIYTDQHKNYTYTDKDNIKINSDYSIIDSDDLSYDKNHDLSLYDYGISECSKNICIGPNDKSFQIFIKTLKCMITTLDDITHYTTIDNIRDKINIEMSIPHYQYRLVLVVNN